MFEGSAGERLDFRHKTNAIMPGGSVQELQCKVFTFQGGVYQNIPVRFPGEK